MVFQTCFLCIYEHRLLSAVVLFFSLLFCVVIRKILPTCIKILYFFQQFYISVFYICLNVSRTDISIQFKIVKPLYFWKQPILPHNFCHTFFSMSVSRYHFVPLISVCVLASQQFKHLQLTVHFQMCFLHLFFFKHSLPILGHVKWSGVCSRETEPVIGTDTQRGEGGVGIFFLRDWFM